MHDKNLVIFKTWIPLVSFSDIFISNAGGWNPIDSINFIFILSKCF